MSTERITKVAYFFCITFFLMLIAGCESDRQEVSSVSADYVDRILAFRKQKDNFFKYGQSSPIPQEARNSFQGLTYYPPDPTYRIKGIYTSYAQPEKRQGWMLAVGRFTFPLAGENFDLEVWSSKDSEKLSVMFTDSTNKNETYQAGRYIELQREVNGSFIIDFNYAYNPYCHYNSGYVCPLPPPENHISIPVKAGEKRLAGFATH